MARSRHSLMAVQKTKHNNRIPRHVLNILRAYVTAFYSHAPILNNDLQTQHLFALHLTTFGSANFMLVQRRFLASEQDWPSLGRSNSNAKSRRPQLTHCTKVGIRAHVRYMTVAGLDGSVQHINSQIHTRLHQSGPRD